MTSKRLKDKKVPNLRFPGFEEEWETKKLGEVATNVMYGMNAAATNYDGENQYIRITDIDEQTRLFCPNPLSSPDGELDNKYLLHKGDILFARTGASVGKSYLYNDKDGKVYFAGFLIRLNVRAEDPYFIFSQTLTEKYQRWVVTMSMRSGQPGINAEEYKLLPIVTPSIQEQEKISSFLLLIDERIQAQNKIIEELEQLIKGLCINLILKKVPNTKLNQCVICNTSSLTESEVINQKGTHPVYGATGIISYTADYQIDKDAILIIKDGSGVGKVQYATNKFSVIGTLNYLTIKSQVNLRYILYSLKFFNFEKYKVGSGIPHIYFKDYGEALIYCPSLAEQYKIEGLLSSIDKKIEIEKQNLNQLNLQKQFLLKELII
ncbi:restriction endonuclease subunit S [Myroides odoratimimus]|uniref:restriction endonuclease subunit S n=1 Tax=Myroides odoratimimus TaxID=76832 RepID=UPI0025783E45|nr:restriction endonuclease subunit S [Myroides odoratimimus]